MMEEWIDTDKELPPCDGLYEVANNIDSLIDWGVLPYDGIGFWYQNTYRPVQYWRPFHSKKKIYGKVEG